MPEGRPEYGSNPATIHGEALADYNERYAKAVEAYDARPDVVQFKAEEEERHRKKQEKKQGGAP